MRTHLGGWPWLPGKEVPAQQWIVAVVPGPGDQSEDDGVGAGDVVFAADVREVAMETGEGGEAEAGFDNALDDGGRFRGFGWRPVVGDGFGDAAEPDDGEFMGELAVEGDDAAAELGEGHGINSAREYPEREFGMG